MNDLINLKRKYFLFITLLIISMGQDLSAGTFSSLGNILSQFTFGLRNFISYSAKVCPSTEEIELAQRCQKELEETRASISQNYQHFLTSHSQDVSANYEEVKFYFNENLSPKLLECGVEGEKLISDVKNFIVQEKISKINDTFVEIKNGYLPRNIDINCKAEEIVNFLETKKDVLKKHPNIFLMKGRNIDGEKIPCDMQLIVPDKSYAGTNAREQLIIYPTGFFLKKGGFKQMMLVFDYHRHKLKAGLFIDDELKYVDSEVNLTKWLKGPGLPGLMYKTSLFNDNNAPFVVTQKLYLGDLTKFTQNKLSPLDLKRITREVLRGLEKSHREKVIHRDIKPDNIFIDYDSNKNLIGVLGDFGVFDFGDQTSFELKGTALYWPPENKTPAFGNGKKGDMWALGLSLLPTINSSFDWKQIMTKNANDLRAQYRGSVNLNDRVKGKDKPDSYFYKKILADINNYEKLDRLLGTHCDDLFKDKDLQTKDSEMERLICGMIDPNVKTRYSSEFALREIEAICSRPETSCD